MSPPRKAHQCRTCGLPMAGHLRGPDRKLICHQYSPLSSLTPSNSPTPSSRSSRRGSTERQQRAEDVFKPTGGALICAGEPLPLDTFYIPENGFLHRRNPNWDGSPRNSPEYEFDQEGSVDPTEPASSRFNSVAPVKAEPDAFDMMGFGVKPDYAYDSGSDVDSESSSDTESISSRSSSSSSSSADSDALDRLEDLLKSSTSLASVLLTPKKDIIPIQLAAHKLGLHVGLLRQPGGKKKWWMVVGRSWQAVHHLLRNHGLGTMAEQVEDAEEENEAPEVESAASTTMKRARETWMGPCSLVGAGLVGAVLAVGILSCL